MSVCSPRTFRRFTYAVPVLVLMQAVHAQAGNESRWGVRLSFTPKWEIPDQVRDLMFDEEEEGTLKGTEFTVGFVRGSQRGGDCGGD